MPGKRHTAREMAVQMLYQRDMGDATLPQVFQSFDLEEFLRREGGARRNGDVGGAAADDDRTGRREAAEQVRERVHKAFEHARDLVQGTERHRDEIDALIRSQADNWRLERMPVVDRNILRLAVYEMLHHPDVPKLVVLDEAIELAKTYGSEQSSRFVNGLLDGLLKEHVFPGSLK